MKYSCELSLFIFRVENYIAGVLDKYLVDLDNGQNIARKRQRLSLDISCSSVSVIDNTYPEISMFPRASPLGKNLLMED